jgi:hypothetical protein
LAVSNHFSVPSWPGLFLPPGLIGSERDNRGRRDKPGGDALLCVDSKRPESALAPAITASSMSSIVAGGCRRFDRKLWQQDHASIRMQEKFHPVAGLEVKMFPNLLRDRGLAFFRDDGFHRVPSLHSDRRNAAQVRLQMGRRQRVNG